ncbi:hypothetical protein [Wenzhouxiangella sediminis]|uniref:Uncharacterized protein n=1 Tax=Wenzhouxiangella sediminis TaxID=1792836 RepID=A0A3E1K887_9GAMM|nr:hypothetical protein [Wenzhouxiangella sediminis]RFF30242.1 hypothetical protein DZC52_09185 [Wenzhouxiangella sediminis]
MGLAMQWKLMVVLVALPVLAGWYFSWRATGDEVVDAGGALSSDELVVDEPDGTTWYRFLFTTDPESRGLVFPQP